MVVVALVLAFVLPTLLWASVVGNPLVYLEDGVPAGQLIYVLSKLAGLYAVALFTVNLGLMVLRKSTRKHLEYKWSVASHRRLGALITLFVALHIGLFIAATTIRSGHLTTHLLIPRMGSGFYDAMVSLGAIALYVLIAVIIIGVTMRTLLSRTSRKRIHFILVLVLTPLLIAHSYAIGSESNNLLFVLFYLMLGVLWLKGLVQLIKQ